MVAWGCPHLLESLMGIASIGHTLGGAPGSDSSLSWWTKWSESMWSKVLQIHIDISQGNHPRDSRKFRLRPPGDGFEKIKGPPGIHITIHITFQSRWIPIKAWHSRLRHRLDTTLHMLSKSVKSIPGIYHPNRHRSCTPLSRSLVFASKGAIHRMKQIPQLLPQE